MTTDTQAQDEVVRYTQDGGVAVITLNRPSQKNAINLAVTHRMVEILQDFDSRSDLSVAIITGAGGVFCAGMDLKAFLKGERPSIPEYGFAGITQKPPRKPVIAAVEGYALAGGFEIVLSCDLVVAARGARFGVPEVKRGLVAAAGGLVRLPRKIAPQIAMEYLLTGDMLDADRAYGLGLVNILTEDGGALEGALGLAKRISANGPLAVAMTKQVIDYSRRWSEDEWYLAQREMSQPVFTSEDAKEGARAFAEKRAPQWQGR